MQPSWGSGELAAVTGLCRLAGKQKPAEMWNAGFFLNVLMPFEARAHLCPNMLFDNVPLPPLGGRNRAPKHRSRAELRGETSASCPTKGPHGAVAPQGDHSGLLEQSHCCDVGLGKKARKGKGPSAPTCTGHRRHRSPLSSFSERCRTDPLKCQAEGHPTGAISPCQGCTFPALAGTGARMLGRDTGNGRIWALCTSHGPASASSYTQDPSLPSE